MSLLFGNMTICLMSVFLSFFLTEDKKVINRKFRAKIQPEDNKTAEDELKKQLNQHEFIKMEIIGQVRAIDI